MNRFAKRSEEIEIMDDLNCSGEVVHQTLREIEFINKWLGGNQVTLDGIITMSSLVNNSGKISVVDLGCGGGGMLKIIASRLQRKKIDACYIGVDANPNIIAYARRHSTDNPSISFQTTNILRDEFRAQKYDIILATLFFHHFTSDQLITIFHSLISQARIGIIINDLHRHPLAFYPIRILTRLFSKSDMVKYDAPLSVLRGFKKKELTEILEKAGISNYTLKWKWAFRWQIIIMSPTYNSPLEGG